MLARFVVALIAVVSVVLIRGDDIPNNLRAPAGRVVRGASNRNTQVLLYFIISFLSRLECPTEFMFAGALLGEQFQGNRFEQYLHFVTVTMDADVEYGRRNGGAPLRLI
jgi:uncharacterized protein YceH (UPF0502 family)